MKGKRFTVRSIIITSALSVLITLGAVALAVWLLVGTPELAVLTGMKNIEKHYVGQYDKDELADAALEAMVDSLGDRWSYYADPEAYIDVQERRNNSYEGIGVTVEYTRDGLLIKQVEKGSPAEKAGLLVGETITAVDEFDLTGEKGQENSSKIKGEAGTQVLLTVLDGQGESRQIHVFREKMQVEPVTSQMLEDDIAYITIENFYEGSADKAKAAADDLLAQGARAIVFDVRNNPGGYLSELIDLLDHLLPEGVIFQSETKDGARELTESDAHCVDVPMAVLVNADSYSAAEFFAAQLRESVNALIVGQPTCGKGHSQQMFELPGGRAINLSTKTYYTGAGISLIGTGVIPDKEIDLTDDRDTQLEAAVEFLTVS